MSSVHVRRDHSLGVDAAKSALMDFEADLAKRGAKLVWSGPSADVKGPGVSGNVQVTESTVEINLTLGLLARAAGVKADKLEASISRRLASVLSAE